MLKRKCRREKGLKQKWALRIVSLDWRSNWAKVSMERLSLSKARGVHASLASRFLPLLLPRSETMDHRAPAHLVSIFNTLRHTDDKVSLVCTHLCVFRSSHLTVLIKLLFSKSDVYKNGHWASKSFYKKLVSRFTMKQEHTHHCHPQKRICSIASP